MSDSPPPGRQRDASAPPSQDCHGQDHAAKAKRAASGSPVDYRDLKQARKALEDEEKVDEDDTGTLENTTDTTETAVDKESSLN